MEYYFIINPIRGKINKQLIEKNIREACLKRQVYVHKENRWCTVSGKKIPDEEWVVFSVGGDGNLNEVLNGIAKSENKILGNIPTGSGNDFKEHLANMMTEYMILILELLMEDILLMLPVEDLMLMWLTLFHGLGRRNGFR